MAQQKTELTLADIADGPIEEIARRFHVHDPSIAADPWPMLHRLRRECPVAYSEQLGGFWFVSRMEEIREVLRDPHTFSSSANAVPWPEGDVLQTVPIIFDPPKHTDYREAMGTMTSPSSVRDLEQSARRYAREYASSMLASGPECEFISGFAEPYPAKTMLRILGLPEADLDLLLHFRDAMLTEQFSPDPAVVRRFIEVTSPEIAAYVARQVERHRADPSLAESEISVLIEARRRDGSPLTDDEIVRTLALLIGAGLDTVSSTLGWMLLYFARNQDRWHELVAEPALIAGAVEELLRVTSIVTLGRKVTADVELGGHRLEAGQMVVLLLPSAGHDEAVFEDAEAIDFRRSPNAHMAFGGGPHRCWGSHLARMELRIALEELTRAMPAFALAPGREPSTDFGLIMNVNELHITAKPTQS